ncbi:MAG: hypothetical protein J6A22_00650 [Bacteroidales bacterium]|nr:hypothetical protein [Bacteroidales bacterium]
MKRTILSVILIVAAASAHAQDAYSLLELSENQYGGTARTVAMGNAFTALGGDLGSIAINPAGSSVAKHSQFSITPGLGISINTTKGTRMPNGSTPYFDRELKNTKTDFNMPNMGFSMNWDTGRKYGLKNMAFSFIVQTTNNWNEDIYAAGRNTNYTSFMGAMAANAQRNGYTSAMLAADDPFSNPYLDWGTITGYNCFMIDNIREGETIIDDAFAGASEIVLENKEIIVPAPLEQAYGRRKEGNKSEYIFNFSANISDFIHIGLNLGFNSINYSFMEYVKEQAVDYKEFPTMKFEDEEGNQVQGYFNNMKYNYQYNTSGIGCFAKLGVLLTPVAGLRIGAAIQTPVTMNMNEEWVYSGSTAFAFKNSSGVETFSSESPVGKNSYSYSSPYRANFGLAYTFGKWGIISADYELCDYGTMKYFSSGYANDLDYSDELNQHIKEVFGISHMLRGGLEVKPISSLSLRAGYGLTTSAQTISKFTQDISFGLGYSSNGSFFADAACRTRLVPTEYFMIYDNYYGTSDPTTGEFIPDIEHLSPEIMNKASLWEILITFGWRF